MKRGALGLARRRLRVATRSGGKDVGWSGATSSGSASSIAVMRSCHLVPASSSSASSQTTSLARRFFTTTAVARPASISTSTWPTAPDSAAHGSFAAGICSDSVTASRVICAVYRAYRTCGVSLNTPSNASSKVRMLRDDMRAHRSRKLPRPSRSSSHSRKSLPTRYA